MDEKIIIVKISVLPKQIYRVNRWGTSSYKSHAWQGLAFTMGYSLKIKIRKKKHTYSELNTKKKTEF